jgi:aspartyl-tRNA synthetase
MVAGFERYFQIARCFRDEDPRADRAYGEFTQLDLEMSFVSQEDILELTENLFTTMVEELWPEKSIKEKPWPRFTHAEAMDYFGADKFDLRDYKRAGDKWIPANSATSEVGSAETSEVSLGRETDPDELAFAWVIDFPLFAEQSKEDYFHGAGEKYAPSHHMFTAPHPDDIDLLETDPLKVRGLQHDMVLNGFEVGGGSIRIHEADIQEKIFELIGFGEDQKKEFSHMLEAFQYGVPPHGGIAPGIDRILMAILGEPSLRELMAFPTSGSGETAVMSAPSEVTEDQLKELGIEVVEEDD